MEQLFEPCEEIIERIRWNEFKRLRDHLQFVTDGDAHPPGSMVNGKDAHEIHLPMMEPVVRQFAECVKSEKHRCSLRCTDSRPVPLSFLAKPETVWPEWASEFSGENHSLRQSGNLAQGMIFSRKFTRPFWPDRFRLGKEGERNGPRISASKGASVLFTLDALGKLPDNGFHHW